MRYTGFLLNWCAERSRVRFAERMAETGLHVREFGVLTVIADSPGATQQAVADAASIDPSTMVLTLDALEHRGLAERRAHPEDRRKRTVHLTKPGAKLLDSAAKIAEELNNDLFKRLSKRERSELHRLLRKLSGLDDPPTGTRVNLETNPFTKARAPEPRS